ncbi:MAG: hypothetical protein J6K39_03550 [Clostridia bacterium]|nr:hypothetical protein [Clostridia bacterium]
MKTDLEKLEDLDPAMFGMRKAVKIQYRANKIDARKEGARESLSERSPQAKMLSRKRHAQEKERLLREKAAIDEEIEVQKQYEQRRLSRVLSKNNTFERSL